MSFLAAKSTVLAVVTGYGDHCKNNEKDLKLGSLLAIDQETFFTCKVFRLLIFHELSDTIMFASIHGEEKAESK